MKIKQYTRQNIIQKEISNYIRLFKPEYRIIKRWEDKGIKVYTPRVNKIKFGIGLIILGVLFITPFTPELLILPKLTRWVLK